MNDIYLFISINKSGKTGTTKKQIRVKRNGEGFCQTWTNRPSCRRYNNISIFVPLRSYEHESPLKADYQFQTYMNCKSRVPHDTAGAAGCSKETQEGTWMGFSQ